MPQNDTDTIKFPLITQAMTLGKLHTVTVSIAAVNAVVAKAVKGKMPQCIAVRIRDLGTYYDSPVQVYWEQFLQSRNGKKCTKVGKLLKAEIDRRVAIKRKSTINYGTVTFRPAICVSATPIAATVNEIESPDSNVQLRVKLRFFLNGNNYTRLARYDSETDEFIVKIGKEKRVTFLNQREVVKGIGDLLSGS